MTNTDNVESRIMREPFVYQPPSTPLQVIFADKDLLVVNKPAGLLTNPGKGPHLADCLLTRVQQQYPQALLVHRLDTATSGLVVFALRRKAEAVLKQQFANRQVNKIYLARVWQRPEPAHGEINLPLIADLDAPPKNKVCDLTGKQAQTFYAILPETEQPFKAQSQQHPLLALYPVTGRAHQLRVHLQSIGHAILGDPLYAHPEAVQAAPRLLLHATVLQLRQPYSSAPLQFYQPPENTAFGQSFDDHDLLHTLLAQRPTALL